MGWEKLQITPGIFSSSPVHGRDQFVLVLVKHRPPLFLGLQADEVFRVEKAGGVRAVIGTAHLAGAFGDLGKGAKQNSRLIRQPDAFARPGAGRKSAAHPQRALIQVGQKLRADHAADRQIDRQKKAGDARRPR